MNKSFYNGPKLEIGKDYIRIKKRKTRLNYQDIRLNSIKKARPDRAWLLYIIAGLIGLMVILYLFYLVIQGLFSESDFIARSGLFYRKRGIVVVMFILIGGPLFIIYKIKKYFKRDLRLIIKWYHHDFRIKISDMGIKASDLKMFLEERIESGKLIINV